MDSDEDAREKRNRRQGLESLGKYIGGAAIDRLLDGTFNPIIWAAVGVIVSVLVLLKTGILQIANWPTSAFIVLFVLVFLVLGSAIFFMFIAMLASIPYFFQLGISLIFKTPRPTAPRLLRIAVIAFVILTYPIVTVMSWAAWLIDCIGDLRDKTK